MDCGPEYIHDLALDFDKITFDMPDDDNPVNEGYDSSFD